MQLRTGSEGSCGAGNRRLDFSLKKVPDLFFPQFKGAGEGAEDHRAMLQQLSTDAPRIICQLNRSMQHYLIS
jgi:hypothetical protein